MSKVYDEHQKRMAKGHELITESGIEDAAIVEAVLGVLAQDGDRVRFVLGLQEILKAAFEIERQWALDEAEAAPASAPAAAPAEAAPAPAEVCNCKACQLDRAVYPVIVEYATAEEAARLLAEFGEAY